MIHTIELGVGAPEALDLWAQRLRSAGSDAQRRDDSLRVQDYDGLRLERHLAPVRNPSAAGPEQVGR